MTNPTTFPPILDDLATGDDKLDFQPYVDALAEILLDTNTHTPLTLGIFGDWGSGKTSLMKLLKGRLGHTPHRRTVWFNAWKYHQEEALWRAFILRVLDALYPRESGEGPWEMRSRLSLEKLGEEQRAQVQLLERLQSSLYQTVEWEDLGRWAMNWRQGGKELAEVPAYLLFVTTGSEKVAEALGIKPDLAKLLQRESQQHRLEKLTSMEQFEATFRRALQEILGAEGRLVVFVDDLDRCIPEKAIQVLEAIKLFLDVPGCMFVLGLDAEAIEAAVRARYKGEVKAREYLEKIVQLPFILPPIEDEAMLSYVQSLAPALPDPRCAEVFAQGLKLNPRQVKRTLNIYLLLSRLVQKRQQLQDTITPVRLAKIVAIQHAYPDFYALLRLRPGYLPELEGYFRTVQRGERPTTDGSQELPQLPEALRDFQTDEALRRLLCLFEGENARFDHLKPLDVRSYITLTKRSTPLEAPVVISARLPFEPELRMVPAGAFWMGTSDEQITALRRRYDWAKDFDFSDEQPQREITLPAYEIGRYPVTNAEYAEFVRATGHRAPHHWRAATFPEELADHPVVYVSWRDAQAYVQWLQERTEQDYRLPAEAEWEKAARGEDGLLWPWGDKWDAQKCNMKYSGPGETTPVGQYSPDGDSPYGCADMAGNVWEWCRTLYRPYSYRPDEGREDLEGDGYRVLRGGSWYQDDPGWVRCAYRNGILPVIIFTGEGGFRVARGSLK
jgi:formylglycine-generating enzyme required for sulfatase activity